MSKKKYIDYGKLLEERYRLGLDEMSRISKVNAFNHFIDTMPLADVEEVRHGKWIIKNNELHWQDKDHYSLFITCSECGLTHFLGTTRYANEYNEQKFKDNNYELGNTAISYNEKTGEIICGAKMDKE